MAQGGKGGGAAAGGTGGLEEEVKDPGAVFPTEILNNADLLRASEASRDNAEHGLAIGFEVAGDGHGNAAGIGKEDPLLRAFRIHGAKTGEVQFQALTRGVGVDGAIAFVGDALDDGDHPALAADQFRAEALPGQVIAAASHHHVDAEIEIIEGGGDGVAIEDATGTGIEAEKVKQGLNAPAIGSALDDILAESAEGRFCLFRGLSGGGGEVCNDFSGGYLPPGAGLSRVAARTGSCAGDIAVGFRFHGGSWFGFIHDGGSTPAAMSRLLQRAGRGWNAWIE